MCSRFLPWILVAFASCDRVTSPSHRDGGADGAVALWEEVDAGTVNYNAVAGSSPDNVFIVGDQGAILHWDGTALLPEASGTTANLRGLSVVDDTLTYAVGDQGTLLRRQAGIWTPDPSVDTVVLNAVYGTATFAVAAGEQGTILTYWQGSWGKVPNARNDNFYAISNASDGLHVVGALGVVVRVDYKARTITKTDAIPGYTKVLAGAVPHGAGSLLVGLDGGFFYWANSAATRKPPLPQRFLRAISTIDGTVWLVGHEGFVAFGPIDLPLVIVPAPDDRWLLGVYAASATDVWVVGRSGRVMRGPPGARGAIDGGTP